MTLLGQRTKRELQALISKIADDNVVGANEFEELMRLHKSYFDQKQNIVTVKKK